MAANRTRSSTRRADRLLSSMTITTGINGLSRKLGLGSTCRRFFEFTRWPPYTRGAAGLAAGACTCALATRSPSPSPSESQLNSWHDAITFCAAVRLALDQQAGAFLQRRSRHDSATVRTIDSHQQGQPYCLPHPWVRTNLSLRHHSLESTSLTGA